MSQPDYPTPIPQDLEISPSDWYQTPDRVQTAFVALLKRVEALEDRLNRDSSNSSRPPSTDSSTKRSNRRKKATERRKPGAKPGHPGHRQALLEPTSIVSRLPEPCDCGQSGVINLSVYHTHQVIELPVIRPEVTHWRLHQGQCLSCGKLRKASLPAEQTSGYGPRLTAFVGEMAGIVSTSRSVVQDLCASVFSIPLSKGAIQKLVDRVSEAIVPHYDAIERVARAAPVNHLDETSWYTQGARQ